MTNLTTIATGTVKPGTLSDILAKAKVLMKQIRLDSLLNSLAGKGMSEELLESMRSSMSVNRSQSQSVQFLHTLRQMRVKDSHFRYVVEFGSPLLDLDSVLTGN